MEWFVLVIQDVREESSPSSGATGLVGRAGISLAASKKAKKEPESP
jgi:hypothetical protein